jgi:Bacteriophage Mu Gam like protein
MVNRPKNRARSTLVIEMPNSPASLNELGRSLIRVQRRRASVESVIESMKQSIDKRYAAEINDLAETEDLIVSLILQYATAHKNELSTGRRRSIKLRYLEIQWRRNGRGMIEFESDPGAIQYRLKQLKYGCSKSITPEHGEIVRANQTRRTLRKRLGLTNGSARIITKPRPTEMAKGFTTQPIDRALP